MQFGILMRCHMKTETHRENAKFEFVGSFKPRITKDCQQITRKMSKGLCPC